VITPLKVNTMIQDILNRLRQGQYVTYYDLKNVIKNIEPLDRLQLELKLKQRKLELLLEFAKAETGRTPIYNQAEVMRKSLYLLTGNACYNMDGDQYISEEGRILSKKQQNKYYQLLVNAIAN